MTGRYHTICVDPPWPGDWWAHSRRRGRVNQAKYPLMTIDGIKALPIRDLAARDCNLFLWVPAALHREGIGCLIARAWGFRPTTEIIWEKPNLGMGRFPRVCHEILLIARRGRFTLRGPYDVRSVQRWRQSYRLGKRHSAKPEAAMDLIEERSPGPYLEIFSTRRRLGWDAIGSDVDGLDIGESLRSLAQPFELPPAAAIATTLVS